MHIESTEVAEKEWHEVPNFSNLQEGNHGYTLDRLSGELRFGPAIRQRNGTVKCFGQTPPVGAQLIYTHYWYGGGVKGNLLAGELNTLKSSIPYVSRVSNRIKTANGCEAQSIEEAKLEMPNRLRSRQRAVTTDDFEYLVMSEFRSLVGRVKCLPALLPATAVNSNTTPPTPIDLRIVPRLAETDLRPSWAALTAAPELLQRVKIFLDGRRLLVTQLTVAVPTWQWVSVDVIAHSRPGAPENELRQMISRRLYRFLHPQTGGFDGCGWPFGQTLQRWQLHQFLKGERLPGGDAREDRLLRWLRDLEVSLYTANADGNLHPELQEQITCAREGLIVSATHSVRIQST